MDAQSKFAIHAACREGKRESHPGASTEPTLVSDSLTPHSFNRPVTPERELLWESANSHEKKNSRANQEVSLSWGSQAEPTLAKRKDDDGRLPIHWAASANQLDITQLLAEQNGFDVDVQVQS